MSCVSFHFLADGNPLVAAVAAAAAAGRHCWKGATPHICHTWCQISRSAACVSAGAGKLGGIDLVAVVGVGTAVSCLFIYSFYSIVWSKPQFFAGRISRKPGQNCCASVFSAAHIVFIALFEWVFIPRIKKVKHFGRQLEKMTENQCVTRLKIIFPTSLSQGPVQHSDAATLILILLCKTF